MAAVKKVSAAVVMLMSAMLVTGQDQYSGQQVFPGGAGVAATYGSNGQQPQALPQSADEQQPQPYSFHYEVKDPPSGNDYSQQEASDGKTVMGQYQVLLPDGRNLVVKYTADDAMGYMADVQYQAGSQQGGDAYQAGSSQPTSYQGSSDQGMAYQPGSSYQAPSASYPDQQAGLYNSQPPQYGK